MNIKLEILSGAISYMVNSAIKDIEVDSSLAVNTVAVVALNEIKKVIQNEAIEDDFDVVERIVCILEKFNIDTGSRHDF